MFLRQFTKSNRFARSRYRVAQLGLYALLLSACASGPGPSSQQAGASGVDTDGALLVDTGNGFSRVVTGSIVIAGPTGTVR